LVIWTILTRRARLSGVSYRTQEIFLIVFVTRYLDLFTNFVSLYNTSMKILYIAMSGLTVHLMRNKEPWKSSVDKERDNFDHYKFICAPCFVLAIFVNEGFSVFEVRPAPHSCSHLRS
jgi:ER lumen protein retaining receptor